MYANQKNLAVCLVLSGFLLLASLPVGQSLGVWHPLFFVLCVSHYLLLLLAVAHGVSRHVQILKQAGSIGAASAVLSVLALLAIVLEASLPITARDALIHHLAVPKWWLQDGKVHFIEWHEWSYYPMLLQLAFTPMLAAGLERLCPVYHLFYLLILSSQVLLFVKDSTKDSRSAAAASSVVMSVPLFMRLASEPLVDLGLAVYTLAGLIGWLNWLADSRDRGWLWICGISLGLAMGIKFNALLFCALFFPLAFLSALRQRVGFWVAVKACILCGLLAVMVYSPWMIRSYVATGNPVYPLMKQHFSASQVQAPSPLPAAGPRGLTPLEQRRFQYQESWLYIAALPLRVFLQGEDGLGRLFDGLLTPLLLLSLLCIPRTGQKSYVFAMFWISVAYILFALVISGARVRYLIPAVAPLSIVGIGLLRQYGPVRSRFVMALLCAQFVWSGAYAVKWIRTSGAFDYVFGVQTAAQYLRMRVPEYQLAQYVNSSLPEDAKIYLLFTSNRYFYFDRDIISAGHNSGRELISWLVQGLDADGIARRFHDKGVTHIIAFAPRAKDALEASLEDRHRLVWNEFQAVHLRPVYSAGQALLWELR